jgi:HAD superfamily hydrolase (TIGR01484 family)
VAPRPLAELTQAFPEGLGHLVGILCDIDDTVTLHGQVVPKALTIMAEARRRGLLVVPVTGRPAGWVDHIARMWPVDGVVGENGGLWSWMADGKLHVRFEQDAQTRATNMARLDALGERILQDVPGSAIASDQPYRALDLAIDFCEDVPPLGDAGIDAIVQCFHDAGATCKVSSIHVNGWFGSFDKIAGFRRFHAERFGGELDLSRWAFFGDSANDEPMFKAFDLSIGVANVAKFLPRMAAHPTWIATREGGEGFVEGMEAILSLR